MIDLSEWHSENPNGSLSVKGGRVGWTKSDRRAVRYIGRETSIVDDSAELDASVERLKVLEIETVYPGHGEPFQMRQFLGDSQ